MTDSHLAAFCNRKGIIVDQTLFGLCWYGWKLKVLPGLIFCLLLPCTCKLIPALYLREFEIYCPLLPRTYRLPTHPMHLPTSASPTLHCFHPKSALITVCLKTNALCFITSGNKNRLELFSRLFEESPA